ncbi:hypothetical protein HNR60_001781 [Rhodopseudomonas rhenobacensis]|uniref:Sulfotransferase family protein n=1 Tax=Rhodopseudomonas rhenobacensis TaxID=87461 RepID=A0A7W8DY91_9BRAD|nr:hypothetical protein [Rhodopseudomonas rhenobacensis]MBB5047029.1 hypothetical protein [Rhodopseudomonas rhenobacensis]
MLKKPEYSVEFVMIAEAGALEAQALLLCESIRRFAGTYADCPITVISPRSDRRPSEASIRAFDRLRADYLPIEIDSCCPQYGSSYRVHALAFAERRPGPPVLVQLDSDTIFIAEPDFALRDSSVAARPVDVKGMCSTGSGDGFDDYWRGLCALVDVDCDALPLLETTVERQAVRASYNGGLVAARRCCGLFSRTEEIFRRLVDAEMKPWTDCGPTIRTGTGLLGGAATAYWGTSQAAISLAAVTGHHAVEELPASHNFPMHLIDQLTTPIPPRLVHLHYHDLFSAEHAGSNPIFDGRLELPDEVTRWLQARLPLRAQSGRIAPRDAHGSGPQRQAILVLGMHRSGTSALAGAINALGAAGPKHLMPANHANPKGYWESSLLAAANDAMLAAAGSSWDDCRRFDPRWIETRAAQRHRQLIKAVLIEEFDDAPLILIKDPRICRFVPLIASILPELDLAAVAILPIRHPLEVAASLRRRDGFDVAKSLLIWLRHVLDAEYASRDMPRYVLRLESFLGDWRGHLRRAAEATGVAWQPSESSEAEVDRLLTEELYHQRASIDELQTQPALVRETYQVLIAMAAEGDSAELREWLDRLRAQLDEGCELFGAGPRTDETVSEPLRRELDRQTAACDALVAANRDLSARNDTLAQAYQYAAAERAALSASNANLRLAQDIVATERDRLRQQRNGLQTERDALRASRSWRWTAPLRWLRRHLLPPA